MAKAGRLGGGMRPYKGIPNHDTSGRVGLQPSYTNFLPAESVKLRFAVCCLSNSNDSCVVPSGNVGRGTSPFILVQLSFDLEAIVEGDIFDDPCRPCQLQRISCIVSPRSTRCATCVRAGHACSSMFSIKLSRSHGSLTAVQARMASAETVLGHRIGTSTETLSKLQKTQVEISNLQVELDILRRRRTRMRSYEYSSSPHRASSSPAFSEISSVPNASVTGIPSSPGEVPALAPSLEIAPGLPPGP